MKNINFWKFHFIGFFIQVNVMIFLLRINNNVVYSFGFHNKLISSFLKYIKYCIVYLITVIHLKHNLFLINVMIQYIYFVESLF